MYKVQIIKNFSAAHYLPQYQGSCEALHGHNWKVEVSVSAKKLNDLGMVVDFRKLKKITNSVINTLDHKCLNEVDYFKKQPPSSEKIAEYIYRELEKQLPKGPNLKEVKVWETDNSCASYSKE